VSCNYDETEEEISFILTNSGKIAFTSKNSFFAVMTDSENNFLSEGDLFDSGALGVGESKSDTLDVTGLSSPITLKITSGVCGLVDARATCK
jgi:hypothetical protein